MPPPATPRTLACERCGTALTCKAGTGERCWCAEEPFRLPMPLPDGVGPFGDCLCPKCLREVTAELAQRPEFTRRAE